MRLAPFLKLPAAAWLGSSRHLPASPQGLDLDIMTAASRHRRSYNDPGHAHELTFTCYRRYRFLASDRTCGWLADAIAKARAELDFRALGLRVYAGARPPDCFAAQPKYEISTILKAIKSPVARRAIDFLKVEAPEWLPRITRRRGTRTERLFWQSGGGYDRNIDEPKTMMTMIEYVHNNPVRRGLVTRASDWRWSSAGWYEGISTRELIPDRLPPEWVATE